MVVQQNISLWLIEFVATVINQHLVGKDVRTAFERMKHELRRGEVLRLVCHVMLRVSGKVRRRCPGRKVVSTGMLVNPSELLRGASGCTKL